MSAKKYFAPMTKRRLILALILLCSTTYVFSFPNQEKKHFRNFLKKSQDSWQFMQKYDLHGGYDTNVNRSFDEPPEGKNTSTPTYQAKINYMLFRILKESDTNLSFSFNGNYEGYTKYNKLDVAHGNFTARIAHFLNKKFMVGASASAHLHHQPFLQDYAQRLQATNFSNNGYAFSPFIALYPTDKFTVLFDFDYNHSSFKQPRTNDLYPYTFDSYSGTMDVVHKHKVINSKISINAKKTDYKVLPAFSLDGLSSPNNPKEKLLDVHGKLTLWKKFPRLIPEISLGFARRKDKFENYDTYKSYLPALSFTFPLTDQNRVNLKGEFEDRRYSNRTTVPIIGKTKVHYKVYTNTFLHEWSFKKGYRLFESFVWEERKTNVTLLNFDRNYKRLIGLVGLKISI